MVRVYAALRDRLLVCHGSGTVPDNWATETRLEGHDLECVAASPDAPETVFVGTFEDGLFRSTDGGQTFERLETDFVSEAVMSLAISPHDSDVIYAGTEPSRVYRSTDGGDSWTLLEGLTDLPPNRSGTSHRGRTLITSAGSRWTRSIPTACTWASKRARSSTAQMAARHGTNAPRARVATITVWRPTPTARGASTRRQATLRRE